jgi:opacity protein-like surface antigen
MRKILASAVAAVAALLAAPTFAADVPYYPPIEIPEVDYDLGASFYLRGSAALNVHWAAEVQHGATWPGQVVHPIDEHGYGYSWGAGFGYETGDGLRFDATIDALETKGMHITKDLANGIDVDGEYTLMLRSTLALANVYYDFGFGGDSFGYTGSGGAFGYVGAGAGVAWNHAEVNSPVVGGVPTLVPTGGNVSAAAAVMAGVGYDMGTWVADLGYRGVYINQINNSPTSETADPGLYYKIDNNWVHELRGTVRYRFN